MQAGARFCSFVRFQKRLHLRVVLEPRFGAFGVSYRKKQSFEGCLKMSWFRDRFFYYFRPPKWHPKSTKNHDKPKFGAILGQDGSKEALWIGLVGAKASLFIDFASKYVAFTQNSYLSLYCHLSFLCLLLFAICPSILTRFLTKMKWFLNFLCQTRYVHLCLFH